ncbi:MAG: TrkH family potassium uptake protein [Methylococcaceae bacterium]|nr:MAG: TrkH family potassium uptake protein [Methylococcaceae bacterium]
MNLIGPLAHIFGIVLMGFSGLMATCLMVSFLTGDAAFTAFLHGTLFTLALGLGLFSATLRTKKEVRTRAGFLLVAITWSLLPAFGAIPLMQYLPELSFTDAYFEAMSGLTTTGATVLAGLDGLPGSINLWRHELNWIAGMGIIVFAVAILPILGVGGMQLYKAETPGATKESSLPPRIAQTAKALWVVYAGLTALCMVCLKLVGMNWLDAVCHAFAALSLGGFSTHDTNVGYFDSLAVEIILTVFQLAAGINFATHFVALRRLSAAPYGRDPEAKSFLALVLTSCLVGALVLWYHGTYADFFTALRHVTFNLVTIATDCGFATQDFNQWPIFVPMLMLFLSCISTSSGSTGGGLRMIRTIVLVKQAQREFHLLIHPQAVTPLKIGGSVVSNQVVMSVLGFIFLYFISIVIMVFSLLITGLDFITALSAVIACFNNAGPGLNQVGPAGNYASLTDLQTWICSFAMLLGRVQIFSILILFVPEFWRK